MPSQARIVLLGTVEFSRHCLEETLLNGGNVVAVLTLDKADARFHSDYADLSPTAERYGVPVYKIKRIGAPSSIELVRSLQPDAMFVFGWSQLVPRVILDIPPKGCIGSHPALLPRDRGRHPLIWALVKGYERSGLTFFYLDEEADSGDILWQEPFVIRPQDDAGTLYKRIKSLASDAIREFLPQFDNGSAPRVPQDHSLATYLRKRSEEDGEIDWSGPSRVAHNLIRGLTRPYVGAHTYLDGEKVVVWRSKLSPETGHRDHIRLQPGMVSSEVGGILCVATPDGRLELLDHETASGGRLKAGDRLGPH